jgi:hypothetical protein
LVGADWQDLVQPLLRPALQDLLPPVAEVASLFKLRPNRPPK